MASNATHESRRKARDDDEGTNERAVQFNNQDFQTLRDQCLQSRVLFRDDTFPAQPESLGYKELGRDSPETSGVVWKRPKDLLDGVNDPPLTLELRGLKPLSGAVEDALSRQGGHRQQPVLGDRGNNKAPDPPGHGALPEQELCPNPQFIVDGAKKTDICQGALRDCWLLAAIASLTLDQDILARVVPPGQSFQENYAGIFHFKFWQFGKWVDVVIDDRLPTKDGELLFVHSAERLEFWSALLEKAYAKVNGSYEALSGASSIEGFEDLTGGISEIYQLNTAPPLPFKIIQEALRRGSLLGCSITKTSADETNARTQQELVKGHAYSLVAAEEVHLRDTPVQLVRIRNPWGEVEWTGPWCDDSREWDSVRPDEKAKLKHSAEDGEFWMAYSDFLKQYSKLEICNLMPDTRSSTQVGRRNHHQFEGAWGVDSTAGSSRNNETTLCLNSKFRFQLDAVDKDPHDGKDGCSFLVGLMQKDCRKERREFNSIGFAIYEIPDEYKGRSNVLFGPDVLLRQRAVASSTFAKDREVCGRFKLPPGEYAIVPSILKPHKKSSFILRVFF